MADFTALKEAIQDAIKQNGQKEITGEVLQIILLSMVSTLGDRAINDLMAALAAAVTTLQNSVGDEATARQSAVATLTQNLNTEAQTRAYEDSQLANAIQGEAYLRGQSDNQIRQDFTEELNEEKAARINGDSTLTHNLNVEAQARAAAILNEATLRQGEDYQLRLQINGLSMDFDQLLEDVRQVMRNYKPIVINGDVTNAPDENDLTTTSDNLLKFKDNAYNPIMFSGMGKKFLRKNIRTLSDSYPFDGFVEDINPQEELSGTPANIFWDREGERFVGWVDGVYYLAWTNDDAYVPVSTENIYMYDGNPYKWNGEDFYVDDEELPNVRNVLIQDMINEANTIYVIRYDYTLAENITIPANCVLEFDGGSISGEHTIIGADTGIQACLVEIFNSDVTLAGSWNVAEAYPEWFGAKADDDVDCADAIEKAMDLVFFDGTIYPLHSVPVILSGMYAVSRTITLKPFTILKGQNPRYTGLFALNGFVGDFLFQTKEHVTGPNSRQGFECIGFDCQGHTSGVRIYGANELFICRNIEILRYTTYGMYLTELIRDDEPGRTTTTQNSLFEDLFIQSPTQEVSYGLYLHKCVDSLFIRTTIDSYNNSAYGTMYGIYGVECNCNTFLKLNLEDCKHPIYLTTANAYNFNIIDFLCKNPATDLALYEDINKCAIIRAERTRNLKVDNYKIYANDIDKDINGNDVPDSEKYSRYDLYVENYRGNIILPATISTNIKAGSFSASLREVIINLGNNRLIFAPSFEWSIDNNLDNFLGIDNKIPTSIRSTITDLSIRKRLIGYIDSYTPEGGTAVDVNTICYNNGAKIIKLLGIPYDTELGGLSTDRPTVSQGRFEYQQYFDTQVDKNLHLVDGRWVDALGFSGVVKNGTTAQRNALITNNRFDNKDSGCMVFDTDLGKPVFLKVTDNGSSANPRYTYSWVDATGATV